MYFYADAMLGLDVIKKSLAAADPAFKIDGGEVQHNGAVLASTAPNYAPASNKLGPQFLLFHQPLDPAQYGYRFKKMFCL